MSRTGRMLLRTRLAHEGPWTRHDEVLTPGHALALIGDGTPWVVHWCGGRPCSSDDDDAAAQLADVHAYRHFIGPAEQQRLAAKAERKGRTRTVLMAELWTSARGTQVVVFVEGGPRPWGRRLDPFTAG